MRLTVDGCRLTGARLAAAFQLEHDKLLFIFSVPNEKQAQKGCRRGDFSRQRPLYDLIVQISGEKRDGQGQGC